MSVRLYYLSKKYRQNKQEKIYRKNKIAVIPATFLVIESLGKTCRHVSATLFIMMYKNVSPAGTFASISMRINFNCAAVMYRMTSLAILCMIQSAYKYSTVLWINSTRPPGYITIGSTSVVQRYLDTARHNGLTTYKFQFQRWEHRNATLTCLSLTGARCTHEPWENDDSEKVENYFLCLVFPNIYLFFSFLLSFKRSLRFHEEM